MIEDMLNRFIGIINAEIIASFSVIIVLLSRLFLKRVPPKIYCIMWGFIGARLICPLSIKNFFGITHIADPISVVTTNQGVAHISGSVPYIGNDKGSPLFDVSIEQANDFSVLVISVWAIGVFLMLAYMVVNIVRLRFRTIASVRIARNVWECDRVSYPFVFGLLKPRIFIPSNMNPEDLDCVLLHERAHIKRKDHAWKPIGFVVMALYWYNPFIWCAYLAFCQDVELACDDLVIKCNPDLRKKYLKSLLNCATTSTLNFTCPFSFGKIGFKTRIARIVKHRKCKLIYLFVGITICVMVCMILLTPKAAINDNYDVIFGGEKSVTYTYYSKYDKASITLYDEGSRFIFIPSEIGSRFFVGTYESVDGYLLLNSENGGTYCFAVEKGRLVFMANQSAEVPLFKYTSWDTMPEPSIKDGGVFLIQNGGQDE